MTILKPCGEGESSKLEEAMEVSASYLRKRKAEFDPEEEEEEECHSEPTDVKSKINEPEEDMLRAPEWDVDSFDGLEYYSSPELTSSSDDDKVGMSHSRIYKRQIIESKGFYVDPKLRPCIRYKRIRPFGLDVGDYPGKTYGEYWKELVSICLQKYNEDKDSKVEFVQLVRGNLRAAPRSQSYITFMAREKPDGPLVEYQAKALLTFDGKRHPVLCRPTPKPKL